VFSEAINYYHGDYKRTGVGLDNSQKTVPQNGTKLYTVAKDLYSGNISSTVTNLAYNLTSSSAIPNVLAQGYTYDVLNRLTDVYAETQADNYTGFTLTAAAGTDYASHLTYDANGNITTLMRNSLLRSVPGVTGNTNEMDKMTYSYAQTTTNTFKPGKIYKTNNRLANVTDAFQNDLETTLDDIKDQSAGYVAATPATHNYKYDAKGRIISDVKSGLTSIEWTVSDKVKKITKADGTIISFTYNAQQQRLTKNVDPTGANNDETTIYSYDANGMLMATYEKVYNATTSLFEYKLNDHQMYGQGRLGVYDINEVIVSSPSVATNNPNKQFFELTDHLGSVRAVVSGLKKSNGNADILQLTDYHEFGMAMHKRTFGEGTYRYQYQGSEQDREITNGNNSTYTTEFRGLDVRLGRWLSPDPIIQSSFSPFCSMDNDPIGLTDVLGLSTGGGGGRTSTVSGNHYSVSGGGGGNGGAGNTSGMGGLSNHLSQNFGGGIISNQVASSAPSNIKPISISSNYLPVDLGSLGNGIVDGIIRGLGVGPVEFIIEMSDPVARENLLKVVDLLMGDPMGVMQKIFAAKKDSWSEVLDGGGTEEQKYEVGNDMGEMIGGVMLGTGVTKILKLLDAGKDLKVISKASKIASKGSQKVEDFISPHAYTKHKFDASRISSKSRTQYGEAIDANDIRNQTIKNADKIVKHYDDNGVHYATTYKKSFISNISTSATPTNESRVIINHLNPDKSTQFPLFLKSK
jgi:RHS repeat-associated protein